MFGNRRLRRPAGAGAKRREIKAITRIFESCHLRLLQRQDEQGYYAIGVVGRSISIALFRSAELPQVRLCWHGAQPGQSARRYSSGSGQAFFEVEKCLGVVSLQCKHLASHGESCVFLGIHGDRVIHIDEGVVISSCNAKYQAGEPCTGGLRP